MLYAVSQNGEFRAIEDGWPLNDGETIIDGVPGPYWNTYVKSVSDGVTLWLNGTANLPQPSAYNWEPSNEP
jgi:hypothetical protein